MGTKLDEVIVSFSILLPLILLKSKVKITPLMMFSKISVTFDENLSKVIVFDLILLP